MSMIENEIWLENARQHFDESCVDGDYARAKAIIDDVRSAGFTYEAEILKQELNDIPVSFFTHPSPYQNA